MIIISKKGFKCAYCGKQKKGAYKIVDNEKSCETCNRAYDYIPPKHIIKCPCCKQDWDVTRSLKND